jgi:excisionase family DNA binding protein
MDERLVVTGQVARKMLGVTKNQLSRLIRSKRLKAYKLTPGVINSHYRVYLDSIEEFIRKRHADS